MPAAEDSKFTVLFLEDRPSSIAQIRSLAGRICVNLIVVSSTHHALLALNNCPVDLILSAVHLEDEGVFDFLRIVKKDAKENAIPFVFICLQPSRFTKSINDSLSVTAKALGADHYVILEAIDEESLREAMRVGAENAKRRCQVPTRQQRRSIDASAIRELFPSKETQA